MEQLKQPNLSVIGIEGYCLVYVREVFGIGAKYPTATVAWDNAEYKHPAEQPPMGIAVPIWFSYSGPSGHVAVWDNGTIYSTSAQGDKTFASINELIDWMNEGFVYLGWSEDINGVRVVQPIAVHNETVKPVTWNVRSEPSTAGEILGIVHGGDVINTTVTENGWREITFEGNNGYVSPLAWEN